MNRYFKKMIGFLTIICFCLILAGIFSIPKEDPPSLSVYSSIGSRGTEVRNIQTRLKKWGYYNGAVDGIYGQKTAAAVKYFQRKNGLKVDGIAGKETLKAMGISSSSSSSSNDEYLLARMISAEARGEPYLGQVAVGAVILNRVESPSFPNTVSGVIYQKGAFTAITDGQWNKPISDSAWRAAREALAGSDPTGGAIYYFNPNKTSNSFMWSRPVLTVIGSHKFCK